MVTGGGLARGMRIEFLYRAIRQPRIYEDMSEIRRITIARQLLRGQAEYSIVDRE
jgi:alkylation response protein AidB-like acyl-CoA dehydrogenase